MEATLTTQPLSTAPMRARTDWMPWAGRVLSALPILGMAMSVRGDEIDSQGAYDDEVRSSADFFYDLIKKEAEILGSALVLLGGISALTKLGVVGAIVALILEVALVQLPGDRN